MHSIRKAVWAAVLAVPALSFASPLQLHCPAGTKQVGGQESRFEATLCVKTTSEREFHGPYVVQYPNGQKRAEGQYENNARSGRWTFYDEKGAKTGETDFLAGNYHGRRVEFFPNGKPKLEETWVNGKRQGEVRTYDQMGKVAVQTFKDDRPVALK